MNRCRQEMNELTLRYKIYSKRAEDRAIGGLVGNEEEEDVRDETTISV